MLRWNVIAVLHQLREEARLLLLSRRRLRLLTDRLRARIQTFSCLTS